MAKSKQKSAAPQETVTARQVHSAAGQDKRTKATLAALGFGKIGKERSFKSSPALMGQLARVSHLVVINH